MCGKGTKFQEYADSFDAFAQAPPQLTIKGRDYIHSRAGLVASLFLYLFVAFFSVYRVTQVITKSASNASEIVEGGQHTTPETGLRMHTELGFWAIGVSSAKDGLVKHSPAYIDFQFTVWSSIGNIYTKEQTGGLHICTEEDYSKMFEPRKPMTSGFENIKKQNGWMCHNKKDDKG